MFAFRELSKANAIAERPNAARHENAPLRAAGINSGERKSARREGEGRATARKTLEGCRPTSRTYVGYPPDDEHQPQPDAEAAQELTCARSAA